MSEERERERRRKTVTQTHHWTPMRRQIKSNMIPQYMSIDWIWFWLGIYVHLANANTHSGRTWWFHFLSSIQYSHTNSVFCFASFFLIFCLCCLLTDPPSAPIISGYVEGSIIPAGSIQKLVCISSGGNPLATLTWYKNDKKVSRHWNSLFVCHFFPFFLPPNASTHTYTLPTHLCALCVA